MKSRVHSRGFAMIAFITLMALMSSWLIATALNRTSAELTLERDRTARDALQKAKAALIAYAISESWQSYGGYEFKQPGGLPCPDTDADGRAEGLCVTAVSRVGRLPWKNLGADDLRDATGAQLWYALSANFRKYPYAAGGYTVINSGTQGQLTVTGATPATNVVAIVFAPGAALSGQNRDPANAAAYNLPANFLEGVNAGYDSFTSSTTATDTYNDRMLVITQADLMNAVEPVVAMMLERDVKPLMTAYASLWGRYPWPAPFTSVTYPNPGCNGNVACAAADTRTQNQYLGDTTLTSGLLPVSTNAPYAWTAGSGSVSVASGVGTVPPGFTSCTTTGATLKCDFMVVGTGLFLVVSNLRIRIQGQATNVGTSFASLGGITLMQCTASATNCTTPVTLTATTTTSTGLTSANNGTATVTYEGTYTTCVILCTRYMQVSIPITASTLTSPSYTTNASAAWFTSNEWWRYTYYAVSAADVPGGTGTCNTTGVPPVCLTVADITGTTNNKKALLVLAGRSLDGASRPSATLANYFEGQNATPADSVYQHRAGGPTWINDRVVVVSP
jgi:hypothetical protein